MTTILIYHQIYFFREFHGFLRQIAIFTITPVADEVASDGVCDLPRCIYIVIMIYHVTADVNLKLNQCTNPGVLIQLDPTGLSSIQNDPT